VKCLALGRDTLTKILGDQVQVITFRNLQKWAFEKNAILSKLLKTQIEKVLDVMKISNFKAGDVILKKGSAANQKIIVIVEGALKKVLIFFNFNDLFNFLFRLFIFFKKFEIFFNHHWKY